MTPPQISVLVASYNVEPYLGRCLDSLVGQTLEDLDIVVVDDASTDGSAELAAEYARRDPRVRLVRHPSNRGIGGVRNTGLDAARGRYLAFVDGDDWLREDGLEAIWSRCRRAGAPIGLFPAVDYVDAEGRYQPNRYTALQVPSRFRMGPSVLGRVCATTWSKLYDRRLVEESGVRFPVGLEHEDEQFHFCFFAKTEPWVVTLDEPIYVYRQRPGSVMARHHHTRRFVPAIFSNIWEFLLENDLSERYGALLCRMLGAQFDEMLATLHGDAQEAFYEGLRGLVLRIRESGRGPAELPLPLESVLESDYTGFLQDRNRQLIALRQDAWYRFGRLPPSGKVRRLARLGLDRIGLGGLVDRIRGAFRSGGP